MLKREGSVRKRDGSLKRDGGGEEPQNSGGPIQGSIARKGCILICPHCTRAVMRTTQDILGTDEISVHQFVYLDGSPVPVETMTQCPSCKSAGLSPSPLAFFRIFAPPKGS